MLGHQGIAHISGEVFRAPQFTVFNYCVWLYTMTVVAFRFVPVHPRFFLHEVSGDNWIKFRPPDIGGALTEGARRDASYESSTLHFARQS